MKRMLVFIIIGLALFGVGVGSGMFFGRSLNSAGNKTEQGSATTTAAPGPVLSVGEFTVNLAGTVNRMLSFSVSLELLNAKADDMIKSQKWETRMRSEILLITKDKMYEDLTKAEGVVQFGEEIKRTLNKVLPSLKGEMPVVRVMFESFILQ
jgi:flagellar FliL protein